ncbi:hypothetical protein PFISCL1PPCAC_4571, partial [Pristionchus fissidentatus]
MPQAEIAREIQTSALAERLDSTGPLDTVFLVNALAALVVQSSRDPIIFYRFCLQVCFVDANTRDSLYKVGGEAIGTVLGAKNHRHSMHSLRLSIEAMIIWRSTQLTFSLLPLFISARLANPWWEEPSV